MFQKNSTEKEVFAIFLWLMGIILFYALIHTFLLEPSSDNTTSGHHVEATNTAATHKVEHKSTVMPKPSTDHAPSVHHVEATNTAATHIQQKESAVKGGKEETPVVKIQTVKKVETPVTKTKHVVRTVAPAPTLVKVSTPIDILKVPTEKTQTPKTNDTKTTTTPIAKVPTVPTVPTVSIPIQVTKTPQQKAMEIQKSLVSSVEKKTKTTVESQKVAEKKTLEVEVYDRDANRKLLETVRQHVIEKAEAARAEAMKNLGR